MVAHELNYGWFETKLLGQSSRITWKFFSPVIGGNWLRYVESTWAGTQRLSLHPAINYWPEKHFYTKSNGQWPMICVQINQSVVLYSHHCEVQPWWAIFRSICNFNCIQIGSLVVRQGYSRCYQKPNQILTLPTHNVKGKLYKTLVKISEEKCFKTRLFTWSPWVT